MELLDILVPEVRVFINIFLNKTNFLGLVEQKHRCIVDPLMKYYQEDENGEWVKYLHKLVESYNTTIRAYNACSPREFLFGINNNNILPGILFI